ncbi:alcohol dehydrogenase [Pullulanibacillus camelliae]|uniref:Alcohol dehydrogenase n=1 Tax=Pullulanibacillus camelliae TaxID=1707096 RepID=A0A8J2YG59_9BACL|nr:NAD(P)-dependent alcohol dehydrogenase [Pullulanibacillus camelliae]GGE32852.1 alcohol dehydrogenase [Pullulanibacillus camelliae]
MEMKAASLYEPKGDFVFENVEIREPKSNEVLIKIVASGVCHTDAVAREQFVPVPLPVVLGHEGSGIVEKVGADVTTVKPGDHVVLSFSSCGHCENCLTGHPSACEQLNDLNFGGVMNDGTKRIHKHGEEFSTFFGQSSFATYAVSNERNVVKIDEDVDLRLLGPLGCGIQTGSGTVLNKLKPEFGSTIAIYGAGAVGLSAIMAAKIVGCSKIIAVDVHDSRLELAKELGATHVINGAKVDTVEEVRRITGKGTHYAVDTAGVPAVTRQALNGLKSMGTLAIVGATGDLTVNVQTELMGEVKSIIGVVEGDAIPQTFIPKLVQYYKEGQFPFDKLVKFYDFEELETAFEDSKSGATIKPIVVMQEA